MRMVQAYNRTISAAKRDKMVDRKMRSSRIMRLFQKKPETLGILFAIILSRSQSTLFAQAGAAAAASSFPAPLPDHPPRSSAKRINYWTESGGGASSDDEGGDEEDDMSSSEEFEDHPEEHENTLSWFPQYNKHASPTDHKEELERISSRKNEKMNVEGSLASSEQPHPLPSRGNSPIETARTEKNNRTVEAESPPLQTIHKLQRMLDDTDYMTSTPSRSRESSSKDDRNSSHSSKATGTSLIAREGNVPESPTKETRDDPIDDNASSSIDASQASTASETTISSPVEPQDRLWTSKDRSKYKRVQKRMRLVSPPIHLTSDDEASDTDGTDDGLGYVLPNVPVYFSDGEESEEAESEEAEDEYEGNRTESPPPLPPLAGSAEKMVSIAPWTEQSLKDDGKETVALTKPLHQWHSTHAPPPGTVYPHQHDGQLSQPQGLGRPYNPYVNGYPYAPPYQQPYGAYMHPQQQYPYVNPYQQWNQGGYALPPQSLYPQGTAPGQNWAQPLLQPPAQVTQSPKPSMEPPTTKHGNVRGTMAAGVQLPSPLYAMKTSDMSSMVFTPPLMSETHSLAEASSKISFDAIQKIALMLVTVALACYAGVSPRTLPLTEYNLKFYDNFRLVSLAIISPAIKLLTVFDASVNDVNDAVNAFFASFTLGYPMAFVLEIVATTLVRLAVFAWFEPRIFSLAPKVPIPLIPWTLRENHYRPKRITLLAADFCASCVASPVIEEYVKLKTLQWTTNLRKNFRWVKKGSSSKNSKKSYRRLIAEPVQRHPGETDVITANQYVTQMLAVSIGMKLCDAGRRILMYTKAGDANKSFYAFCRGLFPIHELCGTMTAIGLARRDLLGVNLPVWKLLFPAVLIHGMANMRGKKPLFRWGSATPWSEMQLSPLHVLDPSTLPKLLSKGFAKLMWLVLLSRVLGYCIKNYYLVNRHAVKRTTRYAGNHAAFSAELATAEMLKKK